MKKIQRGFTWMILLLFISLIIVGCTLISMQVSNTQGTGNACRVTDSNKSATDLNSPDVCKPEETQNGND